jgi:hypothetical protein
MKKGIVKLIIKTNKIAQLFWYPVKKSLRTYFHGIIYNHGGSKYKKYMHCTKECGVRFLNILLLKNH